MNLLTRTTLSFFILAATAVGNAADGPFKDAAVVWRFGDREDSTLTIHGDVKLGVELTGDERAASLARGGDGKVAQFNGGHLEIGGPAFDPPGAEFTLLLRVRDPQGVWEAPLFGSYGGDGKASLYLRGVDGATLPREDRSFTGGKVSTPAAWMFGWPEGPRAIHGSRGVIEFLWGATNLPAPFEQRKMLPMKFPDAPLFSDASNAVLRVMFPMELVGARDWHDVVVRGTGAKLQLWIDGVLLDEEYPIGTTRAATAPRFFGAAQLADGKVLSGFRGLMDHAALWHRALSDAEIVALSGGANLTQQRELAILGDESSSMQYFRARGHNSKAGDCIPYWDDRTGTFRLFYLILRRNQHSKWDGGHGGLEIWQASTKDLKTWTHHPVTIPITEQWEAWNGTGAVAFHNGQYNWFYPTPDYYSDHGGVQRAVSKDGVTFTKTTPHPFMPGGDVEIFQTEDGLFHLIKKGPEQRAKTKPLRNKTLVAWVRCADLDQQGGSVLTIEHPDATQFDGIVFGEVASRRWMPGSDRHQRTPRGQSGWAEETSKPDAVVQVAVVTDGAKGMLYRNATLYAAYPVKAPVVFPTGSSLLMGLRHTMATAVRAYFHGQILDARVYDSALSPEQLAALKPDAAGGPKPVAWYDFEGGSLRDRTGTFPDAMLFGNARIEKGELVVSDGDYLKVPGAFYTQVRLTSPDLEKWTEQPGAFITSDKQLAICPHVFKFGGWHYYICGSGVWKSRNWFGPWTENTPLRLDNLSVPKSGAFGKNRRISAGFLSDEGWGGNEVLRELVQDADGNLGTRFVNEMIPATGAPLSVQNSVRVPATGKFDLPKIPNDYRLQMEIVPEAGASAFGVSLRADVSDGCKLVFRPATKLVSFSTMGGSSGKSSGGPVIEAVRGLDKPFTVDIIVRHDILDAEIAGKRSLVTRFWNPGADRIRFFAEGGAVTFRNTRVSPLKETYKPYPGWTLPTNVKAINRPKYVEPAAATFYVRPDGADTNDGVADSPTHAWCSIDRGQPTILAEDVRTGQHAVRVEKASQLPAHGRVRIGKTVVTYSDRDAKTLIGCGGVTPAKAGERVISLDWFPPQPGDTVIVRGCFFAKPETVAVRVRAGGSASKPVVFRGEGWPVVDGRDVALAWQVDASHVRIEGFDVRRGGITMTGDDNAVSGCRVHEGKRGIYFRSARAGEIERNLVFDLHGAWTEAGIVAGDSQDVRLHHNTVVSCGQGLRLFGARSRNCTISSNLVAWCSVGFKADNQAAPTAGDFHGNLFWKNGSIRWLLSEKPNEGTSHYSGLTFPPDDLHTDPKIASWESSSPAFLSPHPTSPCVKEGQTLIGARPPQPYPVLETLPGENLVFNPSFESGSLGWTFAAWNNLPGRVGARVVEAAGAEARCCLEVFCNPPAGERIALRVLSSHFRVSRGRPLTLSFRARAEAEGATLSAGFGFPSWQNQSAITQNFKLSTNWCSFTTTRELAPFLPDLVCASLTAERGRVWLDAVKVEQGPQATPFDPPWELTLPDLPLGMLLAPGQPLAAEILNRTPAAAEGQLRWRLFSPFGGEEARGEQPFACSPAARVALPLRFPAGLEGLFLLQHEFVVGGKTMARGRLRLAIGWPAPAGPNRPFFSSTPNYGSVLLDEPWRQQCRALSALGLGTLHLYLGLNRIRESATTDKLNRIVEGAQAAGLQWLFTPSDDNLFAGKSSWAPGPGNVGTEPIEAKPDGAKVTEAQLRAWQAELKDFIPRFRGKVKFWEICNEPNVLFTGDEYQRIAHVVAPLLRQLDPASHIAAGSVVNAHRSDLHRKTMELPPGTFDSFSYHPYRFGLRNPESEGMSFRRALLETKADLVAAGHAPKIWLTEEGQGPGLEETRCRGSYLSFDPLWTVEWGEGEIRQAQYLARMYLTALGEGCVGYSYHTLQNLVRDDAMTPSLALKAIHTMACVLATGEPKGPLALGDDFVGYQFTADRGTTVAALWMKDADYGSPVELPMTLPMAAQLSARNMLGGVVPVRSDGGKCSLRLDRQVIYLVFQNANPDAARQSLEAAFASFARCDAASSKPSTKMGQSTSWPARTAQERVVPDRQISAGWMHSGYPGWTLPTNLGATNRPKAVEPAVAQAKPPQKETKPAPKPRQPPAVVTATDAMVRDARLLRERFLADPYRPTYHFCVPEDMGRPGDPNGAFYHNGRYHLMYLYNRLESGFCWGHISSSDLVHWRHHPDAIGPGHGDEGCFSGGAFVDDDGAAYLSYWMLWDAKGIGLAKSSDAGFNVWTKLAANPVIKSTEWGVTETKDETGKTIFYGSADPSNIWKKDGRYYMLTGNLLLLNKLGRKPDAPLSEQGDRLYLFVSDNLKDWKYLHVFYERKPEWTDRSEDNMCPSFLPLPSSPDGGPASGKHLLLFISHNKGCQYYVGDYRNDRFFPNNHGRMSWVDNTHFAPEALMDGKGRQIMWAWLTDNPPGEKENGWSGVYGLPRSLWLGEDGTLRMQPVKELETLRSRETTWNNLALSDGETKPLEGVAGDSCELGMEIELGTAQRCGVKVRAAPGGEEETLLYYDADKKELVFDSTRSGKAGRKVVERAPFTLKTGEPLKLRVFVDKSVVELYANDRQAIGRRVYPTRPDSLGVSVFANGGPAKARQVKAWQIEPSNPY